MLVIQSNIMGHLSSFSINNLNCHRYLKKTKTWITQKHFILTFPCGRPTDWRASSTLFFSSLLELTYLRMLVIQNERHLFNTNLYFDTNTTILSWTTLYRGQLELVPDHWHLRWTQNHAPFQTRGGEWLNPRLVETLRSLFENQRLGPNMWDFQTLCKGCWDFQIELKVSETQDFRGTIHHPSDSIPKVKLSLRNINSRVLFWRVWDIFYL